MNFLRWLIFIPAGFAAKILVEHFWMMIVDSFIFLNLLPMLYLSSLTSGAVFVYVSVKISPTSRKYAVSIFMCVLQLLGCVLLLLGPVLTLGFTLYTLIPIVHLMGGLLVTYKIRKNDF
ncbi:hypothetical protein N9I73_05395 [Porticoccaceae bacterium]|nr:hypothetical protein [Porticoccaceae bacterium]MDA9014994.1 hypothetical protein [Porticoccaceae bacterium]